MMQEPKIIEIKHNFHDALADTISEKNEALYVALYYLKDSLGGEIKHMIVSKAFWNDNWGQVWMDLVFKPVQIQEQMEDGTVKVATFHNTYDVCIGDYADDAQDWVMIVCNEGVGRVKIEGFRS